MTEYIEYEVISDKVFGYVYADDCNIGEDGVAIFFRDGQEVGRIENVRSVHVVEDVGI